MQAKQADGLWIPVLKGDTIGENFRKVFSLPSAQVCSAGDLGCDYAP